MAKLQTFGSLHIYIVEKTQLTLLFQGPLAKGDKSSISNYEEMK